MRLNLNEYWLCNRWRVIGVRAYKFTYIGFISWYKIMKSEGLYRVIDQPTYMKNVQTNLETGICFDCHHEVIIHDQLHEFDLELMRNHVNLLLKCSNCGEEYVGVFGLVKMWRNEEEC